jgi:hypothetical protein
VRADDLPKNGTSVPSPVWFRFYEGALEAVIAEGDIKLGHLEHRPECSLLIFESIPPFRGLRVEDVPTLKPDAGYEARRSIAERYLGTVRGRRFGQRGEPGVVLRVSLENARTWDLAGILPLIEPPPWSRKGAAPRPWPSAPISCTPDHVSVGERRTAIRGAHRWDVVSVTVSGSACGHVVAAMRLTRVASAGGSV